MRILRRFRLVVLIAVLSGALVAVGGQPQGPPAHVDGPPDHAGPPEQDDSQVSSTTPLLPVAPDQDGGVSAAALSPANCRGKSNNPHYSTGGGGQIKGVAQIDCDSAVQTLIVTSQLWKKRWWGWQKAGYKPTITDTWDDQVKASGTYYPCESNDWRTEGEYWSYESGLWYYATNFNPQYVGCP